MTLAIVMGIAWVPVIYWALWEANEQSKKEKLKHKEKQK